MFAAKITPHKRSHERDLLTGVSKGCLRVGTWKTERQTASEQERERTKEQERDREIGRQRVRYDGNGPFKGYSYCI